MNNRLEHENVRQVHAAADIGIVQHDNVALAKRFAVFAEHRLHRIRNGTKM